MKDNTILTYNPNTVQNAPIGHQKQTHVIHQDKRNKRQKNRKQNLQKILREY